MHDENDRPSTETEATPKVPAGKDVKALVTPGDPAEAEGEAEEVAAPGGEMPGANERDDGEDAAEKPDGKSASTTGLAG